MSSATTVLLCGVGGQGTVLAADLLARTALASGYDVKVSEIHGMSQRGGAVTTVARFGTEPVATMVADAGCADCVVSFETTEALRNLPFVREGGYRFAEDVQRSEDIAFVYPALVDAERIATVGERLISYRVMRAGSAMATKDRHAFDFVRAIHSFRSYLAETGRLEALSRSYATWAMSSILYNLNTLASYFAFCEVYRYLVDRGFSDLGLADLGEHDFLDPIYYARMREISECDPAAYLFGRACSLDAAREDALAVLDEVSAARDEALAERDAACAREAAVRADLDRVVSEFDAVMGAAEQRVGQAICRLPRAIQRKVGASKR